MSLLANIVINLYSVILTAIIVYHNKRVTDNGAMQNRVYNWSCITIIICLIADIFSGLDGYPGTIYLILNAVGNFVIYFLYLVIPCLWLIYVHCIVYEGVFEYKPLFRLSILFNFIYVISVVCSMFYGWYYYIDENNIYHRGTYSMVPNYMVSIIALSTLVMVVINRNKIAKEYFYSLLFFEVPPVVGALLTIYINGISLMLNFIVISLLIICLNVENQDLYIDYLTGVFNRKKLDMHMSKIIENSSTKRNFSAILFDLDGFKKINDCYGHNEGDDAIRIAVRIIKECLGKKDLLSRYGGDEFCAVLHNSGKTYLDTMVEKIRLHTKEFNETKRKPYLIHFSMGYAVYDANSEKSINEFQKKINQLMYEDKLRNKKIFEFL